MAFLLTDAREYRELPCPGTVTIGRGTENSIRPESQSVSKAHAIITINRIANTSKVEVYLEDLNSRNGTFVGETPLDCEKMTGRRRLQYGDYIRFGHSQKYFRLLDQLPHDEDVEIKVVTAETFERSRQMEPSASYESLGIDHTIDDPHRISSARNLPGESGGGSLRMDSTNIVGSSSRRYQGLQVIEEDDHNNGDDFNVVLKYNSKRNTRNNPVSLTIGGSGEHNLVKSSGGDISPLRMDESGEHGAPITFGSQPLPIRGVSFAPDIDYSHANRDIAEELGDLPEYSHHPSKGREYDDQLAIQSSTEGACSKDTIPDVKFHAFTASVHSKDHVSKYLNSLKAWEEFIMRGVDPTCTKVDVFLRQLLSEQQVGGDLHQKNKRISVELPHVIREYNKLAHEEKEAISAELLVDSMSVDRNTSTPHEIASALLSLQMLSRSCRQGININDRSAITKYAEVDMALLQEITSIVKKEIERMDTLQQSQLAVSLRQIAGTGHEFNIERHFYQALQILLCIQDFLHGLVDPKNGQALSASEAFEILSLCLYEAQWRLWSSYAMLLGLAAIVQEMVGQRVIAGGGSIGNGSNGASNARMMMAMMLPDNIQLLRERMMNGDDDGIAEAFNEFKQQHVNTAFNRFGRVNRLLDILRRVSLRNAFRTWSSKGHQLKRRDLMLMEAEDTVTARFKRRHFRKWLYLATKKKNMRKCLYRLFRAMKTNHAVPLSRAFKQWKEVAGYNVNLHPSLSQMRMTILKLQNELDVLSNQEKLAGVLSAERALNKELIATNANIRDTLHDLEMKMLESSSLPMNKKQELVYHHLLKKEEELLEVRRENKIVKSELESLRNTIVKRRSSPAAGGGLAAATQQQQARAAAIGMKSPPSSSYSSSHKPPQPPSGVRAHPSMGSGVPLMSKDEARIIVLNEVRRLKDSLGGLYQHRDELQAQFATEQEKSIDLSLANQTLANRVIELERSAVLLRELLLQRLGASAIVDLTEAMIATGAGAHILLNTLPVGGRDGNSNNNASAIPQPSYSSIVGSGSGKAEYAVRRMQPKSQNVMEEEGSDYRNAVSSAFLRGK